MGRHAFCPMRARLSFSFPPFCFTCRLGQRQRRREEGSRWWHGAHKIAYGVSCRLICKSACFSFHNHMTNDSERASDHSIAVPIKSYPIQPHINTENKKKDQSNRINPTAIPIMLSIYSSSRTFILFYVSIFYSILHHPHPIQSIPIQFQPNPIQIQ